MAVIINSPVPYDGPPPPTPPKPNLWQRVKAFLARIWKWIRGL